MGKVAVVPGGSIYFAENLKGRPVAVVKHTGYLSTNESYAACFLASLKIGFN